MTAVTLLTQIRWNGGIFYAGDQLKVKPEVAQRWESRGIALLDPIDVLPAGFPGLRTLNSAGITHFHQLQALTASDLEAVEGLKPATIKRIVERLSEG